MHNYRTATNARHKASDAQALEKWHDIEAHTTELLCRETRLL